MNLGEVIDYCQGARINTVNSKDTFGTLFPYLSVVVVVGNFAMQCHNHDTGYSVHVCIVGAGEPYTIIRGTYWKRSGYDHNRFLHEHGAWDVPFEEAVKELEAKVISHRENKEQFYAEQSKQADEIRLKRKQEVESALFPQQ